MSIIVAMLHTKTKENEALLNAALEGLELQKARIEEQIRQVRTMLGRGGPGRPRKISGAVAAAVAGEAKPKRTLSMQARKRIAIAQKKRWAEYRKANPVEKAG